MKYSISKFRADANLKSSRLAHKTFVIVTSRFEILLSKQIAHSERKRPVFAAAEFREWYCHIHIKNVRGIKPEILVLESSAHTRITHRAEAITTANHDILE